MLRISLKKILPVVLFFCAFLGKSQYMIVGKDSVSLADFKKDNLTALQKNGVQTAMKNAQDYLLLQQFAREKKADTTATFRNNLAAREEELREKYFYPEADVSGVLNDYISASKTERQVQIFFQKKTSGDKNDYKKIYADVTSGRMKMEDAISNITKGEAKPIYVKPGVLDNELYDQLLNLPVGGYTGLIDNPSYIAFAKLTATRPSPGYLIFGVLSYPNDGNAATLKNKIYADLAAGKKFQEITKTYGTTDNEKQNGGVVMGSPLLPDEVYSALYNHPKGYYTQPILMDGKFYIFNIYDVEPYKLTEKNKDFFKKEMMGGNYGFKVRDKLLAKLKSDPSFKESADFAKISNSYQNYSAFKNSGAILYQYKNHRKTFADLLKDFSAAKIPADISQGVWKQVMQSKENQDIMNFYSEDFDKQKFVAEDIAKLKKGLYSDFIFNNYFRKEASDTQRMKDYYDKNKENFKRDAAAKGRVAILSEEKFAKNIQEEMKNPANWDSLQKKYYGKLDDKKQILVHFETGEMAKDAEIFSKYNIPFKEGIYSTKMGEHTVIVAIDAILPPAVLPFEDVNNEVRDALTEQLVRQTLDAQRAATKIVVQPAFINDLEKNFKK